MSSRIGIVALLVLAAAGFLLNESLSGGSEVYGSSANIDPSLLEALEEVDEVEVLISLVNPAIPMSEWTIQLRKVNAAERQASVLSALDENDFTLTYQFEINAALSGLITKTGLEKLRHHPDVVGIGMSRNGKFEI